MSTVAAADVAAGDIVSFRNLSGTDVRARVADVEHLTVTITYPHKGGLRVNYPTVRIHFTAGDSLDYAPDSTVEVVR